MFRKYKEKEPRLRPWQEKTSHRVASAMLWVQRGWAGWMDKHVNRLSRRGKLLALALFSLCMGGLCIYPAIDGNRPAQEFTTKAMVRSPVLPGSDVKKGALPEDLQNRIVTFMGYVDSLVRSPEGQKILDSLLKARPGLIDSIKEVEAYYQLPLKNQ